jgi:Fuc2NAc and GlcNAc transferase
LISKKGRSFGLLDKATKRSSHDGIIPKSGGIGILAAFVFVSLILKMPLAFWLTTVVLSLFSLLGDRMDISPKIRLPVQFIATFIFVQLSTFSFQSSAFSFFFLAVFIVGTANWYNFMDGINGIAGITGLVGFGLLALFNYIAGGDSRFTILLTCIVFSCLGFLPFNFPNARVFMGDVGSILLGYIFACVVVVFSKHILDFICLVGFLFPFYADELITMAIRLKDRENLLEPHRRHFYQILANEMGIAHWKISVGYGVVQSLVGLSILLMRHFGVFVVVSLLILYFFGAICINFIVRMRIDRAV